MFQYQNFLWQYFIKPVLIWPHICLEHFLKIARNSGKISVTHGSSAHFSSHKDQLMLHVEPWIIFLRSHTVSAEIYHPSYFTYCKESCFVALINTHMTLTCRDHHMSVIKHGCVGRRWTARMNELFGLFLAAFGASRRPGSCLLNSSDYCSSGRWTLNKWTRPRQRPSATPPERRGPIFYASGRIFDHLRGDGEARLIRSETLRIVLRWARKRRRRRSCRFARSQTLEWLLAACVCVCRSPTGPRGGFWAQVVIGLRGQRLQPDS